MAEELIRLLECSLSQLNSDELFVSRPSELVTYEALKRAAGFRKKSLQFMKSLAIKFNCHLIKIV